MELLTRLGQFILMQIAILAFLAAAPALFVVLPFAMLATGHGNLGGLAFLYCLAGPFVSAVWTAFFMSIRRVLRTTEFGNRNASCGMRVQVASCGWALFGFLGTVVAAAIFVFLFHSVSSSPTAFFALAPLAVFAPIVLLWVFGDTRRRARYRREMAMYVRIGGRVPPNYDTFEKWSRRIGTP